MDVAGSIVLSTLANMKEGLLTVLLPGGVFILCESSNRGSKSKESHFVTVICQAHLTSNMCSTVALRTHYITHGS